MRSPPHSASYSNATTLNSNRYSTRTNVPNSLRSTNSPATAMSTDSSSRNDRSSGQSCSRSQWTTNECSNST
ncbi:hypothetical protein C480_14590 [Natrialba aegyptia DSM 13077]|uniref:Uncharacterized protein n=1 Tax=Natrialba aegyptia DSM 13077 TaxID=1227491 RepID=M0AY51_9EURY|nr:hypothetical protein C480_14590 [Natrialba aegyptia DSM 13077]